jgi:hypothetical protein
MAIRDYSSDKHRVRRQISTGVLRIEDAVEPRHLVSYSTPLLRQTATSY